MKNKPTKIITALLTNDPREDLLLFGHSERVPLAPTVWCDRFSLRGVESRLIDVLIDQTLTQYGWENAVVQVSAKAGKYDGAERIRLLFRRRPASWNGLPSAELRKRDLERDISLSLVGMDGAVLWAEDFRADWSLAEYDEHPEVARNTVWGHADRHFPRELADDEDVIVEATAEVHSALETLMAEREQYHYMPDVRKLADIALSRVAKDRGWRKCPARVQRQKGVGLWARDADGTGDHKKEMERGYALLEEHDAKKGKK